MISTARWQLGRRYKLNKAHYPIADYDQLLTGPWAIQAENVLLISSSEVSKSLIATVQGPHLIEQGIWVKWVPATSQVQLRQQAIRELGLMVVISRLDKYLVLIMDEIAYVKKLTQKPRLFLNLLFITMKVSVLFLHLSSHSVTGVRYFRIP